VIGFFKKTFSSVKKTFESTFNQPERKRARSKMAGRHTPLNLLDRDDIIVGFNQNASPKVFHYGNRVKFDGTAT
jgi:hypothetical protein